MGKSAQPPKEQSDPVRLKRRIGNLWQKVRKHGSDQGSGETLFGFGQSGFGHQYVQKLSAIRRGIRLSGPAGSRI